MKTTSKNRTTAEGTVVSQTSSFADVEVNGAIVRCRVRGRLKRGDARTDLVVIGDRVTIEYPDRGEPLVDSVAPRRTRLARRHPAHGGKIVEDVLVANLDLALVCVARSSPSCRGGVIDRFLAVAAAGDVPATVVITKSDLPEPENEAALAEVYRRLGIEVVLASTREPGGVDSLAHLVDHRIIALVGPSGVGKSSLANALLPGVGLDVGEVDDNARGRHTTRLARLLPTRSGGYLADTPGIRELALHGVSPTELGGLFPEVVAHRDSCRFRDCKHEVEPGCAVRAAAESGAIAASRYTSYLRLLHGDETGDE